MKKNNNGSGKLKDGFDNFVRNMCQKHNMSEETLLNTMEDMIARKRRELKEKKENKKKVEEKKL